MARDAAQAQAKRDDDNRANMARRDRDVFLQREANARAVANDPNLAKLEEMSQRGLNKRAQRAREQNGIVKTNGRKSNIPVCTYAWKSLPLRTRKAKAAARMAAIKRARTSLLDFMQLMMPDVRQPDNATRSEYKPSYHHQIIAENLELLHDGLLTRVILTCPPRHGKTALATIGFVAWYMGRNPGKSVIVGTYNSEFAEDLGRQVRDYIQSKTFQQIFPGVVLKTDSRAADRLKTGQGGQAVFVGRGGAVTGRGGDLLIIDDPLKDAEEAASPTIRQKMWDWFNKTFMTRGMTDKVRVMLIQTRWHEDDLIGRLTDPKNPDYTEREAAMWAKIDMPALCTDPDNDPLGRDFGDALWPQRFSELYLNGIRSRDPLGFSSLYQCSPAPPEGILFTKDCLQTYKRGELPKNLRIYMASDHAVSTKQQRDKTCIIAGGLDEDDNLWILPEIFWRQASADQVVEGMLGMIVEHKPLIWWAEGGAIGKSLGPFLRKRMQEESTYCAIHEVTPAADKLTRAQAIHGRAMMGKVFFPSFAPWWGEAKDELMKFPTATHDDFVDALSHLGRGLTMMVAADRRAQRKKTTTGPAVGTLAWVKEQSEHERKLARMGEGNGWI